MEDHEDENDDPQGATFVLVEKGRKSAMKQQSTGLQGGPSQRFYHMMNAGALDKKARDNTYKTIE